jgi:hypothetical protein
MLTAAFSYVSAHDTRDSLVLGGYGLGLILIMFAVSWILGGGKRK